MKRCIPTLFLFSIILSTPAVAQHNVDSLTQVVNSGKKDTNIVNALNSLAWTLYNTGVVDKATEYSRQAVTLSFQLHYTKGAGSAYNHLGVIYTGEGQYAKAESLLDTGLALFTSINNKKGIAYCIGNLGRLYEGIGKYPEAIKKDFEAIKIFEEMDNQSGIATAYLNIGNIYLLQVNYEDAQKNYEAALKIYEKLEDKQGMALSYNNIGIIYNDKGQNSEATECDKKALLLRIEIGDTKGMSESYLNIGSGYTKGGHYEEALEYLNKSMAIAKSSHDTGTMSFCYSTIAELYGRKKEYATAEKYMDTSVKLSLAINYQDALQNDYSYLAFFSQQLGDYKSAFTNYRQYIAVRDSLSNKENTRKITQSQMNFEFDRIQAQQRADQERKDYMQEENTRKQRLMIYFISGILLLVVGFAAFVYRSLDQSRKKNIIISEQKALVEEKNKDILDSINYAKRLQEAILPPAGEISKHLPDSFVLYKPKDIVAGDFYWMERVGETTLIAAADCTGHGVPGALVSVVCSTALNRTVNEFNITEPGKILDKARELVMETFAKSESNIQDGMDISLASLTNSEGGTKLSWSGAYNPLWIVQDGAIKEITADKQPIGKTDNSKPFNTHSISINKGDCVYLFTDGYADQFGGEKGKKFKYKQLQQLLVDNTKLSMPEQKQLLEQTFERWKGTLEQTDDVSIIGIRI